MRWSQKSGVNFLESSLRIVLEIDTTNDQVANESEAIYCGYGADGFWDAQAKTSLAS